MKVCNLVLGLMLAANVLTAHGAMMVSAGTTPEFLTLLDRMILAEAVVSYGRHKSGLKPTRSFKEYFIYLSGDEL